MTLDEIKQAIATLSLDERARLRVWLAEVDSPPPEQATEPTSTAEKFGRMAGKAFADFRKRMRDS